VDKAIVHRNLTDVERLPGDRAVDAVREELSETIYVDARRREQNLIRIQAGASIVIVLSQNIIILTPSQRTSQAEDEENNGYRCNPLWARHWASYSRTLIFSWLALKDCRYNFGPPLYS
jgi:hypothetical protein